MRDMVSLQKSYYPELMQLRLKTELDFINPEASNKDKKLTLYKQFKNKLILSNIYKNVNLIFNKDTNSHGNIQLNRFYSSDEKILKIVTILEHFLDVKKGKKISISKDVNLPCLQDSDYVLTQQEMDMYCKNWALS